MQKVIAQMLRLNASSRPSASALLKSPEVAAKLYLDDCSTSFAHSSSEKGVLNLIGTIRVPNNLGKLNSILPKPCYPDVRPNSPTSWTVAEQKEYFVRRPAPLPPLATCSNDSDAESYPSMSSKHAHQPVPSIVSTAVHSLQHAAKLAAAGLEEYCARRPLATVNSNRPATSSSVSEKSKQPRLDGIIPSVPVPPSDPNSKRPPRRKSMDKPPASHGYAPVRERPDKENASVVEYFQPAVPTAPLKQPAGAPSRANHYRKMW